MSWASGRVTTRVEDQAYCLMGLFDVNMPLLYGEGKKAFARLQLEIIKSSDDESIFVHRTRLETSSKPQDLFSGCQFPYAMTNKGLHICISYTLRSSSYALAGGHPRQSCTSILALRRVTPNFKKSRGQDTYYPPRQTNKEG